MTICTDVSIKENPASLSFLNFYLPQLLQAQTSWQPHMLLGSHDLPANEPWTKHNLSCHFFTPTPSQKDTVLLLQASCVNLPRNAGRLKPQTPNWRNTDALESTYMTFNDNYLPKAEKLDSPSATCATVSLTKNKCITVSSVKVCVICLPRLAYITNRLKYCCKWRPCSDTSLLRRFSTALSKWSLKLKLS